MNYSITNVNVDGKEAALDIEIQPDKPIEFIGMTQNACSQHFGGTDKDEIQKKNLET